MAKLASRRRSLPLVLALSLAAAAAAPLALPAERGVLRIGSRRYRDVIDTCFQHPFLTSADMRAYFTNTRGRISTAGGSVSFRYPGIREVRLSGQPLPVLRTWPNLLQVRMPEGVHDVEIVASPERTTAELPAGHERDGAVGTLGQFNERAKALRPGDELVVKDGTYAGWATAVVNASGTASKPIVVRPQTPGGVVFRQRTHIRLQGRHVVFKGFRFEQAGLAHLVYLTDGERLRVTQCQFFHCGHPQNTYSHIVRLGPNCHRSRVDHCFFTGSKSMSIGLRIFDQARAGLDNRLDHNVFRDIYRYAGNGQENIQLGGQRGVVAPRCTVEYCLFDHAWGDSEIISNKSWENVIRYNVAAHCLFSAFTLRQGNDVRFEGNVMVNNAAGVRVFGARHVIANNLFLDMRGAGVVLQTGSKDGAMRTPATATLIAHNTFLNCPDASIVGEGVNATNPFKVRDTRVVNNVLVARQGTLIDLISVDNAQVERNLLWPGPHAVLGHRGKDALVADPRLEGSGAALRPAADGPAVDGALPLKEVKLDRWRRPRPAGRAADLGADELGQAPALDLLPEIPPRPLVLPDLHKQRLVFPSQRSRGDREYRAAAKSATVFNDLSEDFVLEWDHLPDSWSTRASLTFATDEGRGYTVSWGGVDAAGVPICMVELRREPTGEVVADGPDILHHRMAFRRGREYPKPTKPRPRTWYAFTLVKSRGVLWLGLRPNRVFSEMPVVPVVIWQEDRAAHAGRSLRIAQQGPGTFRNIHVWRYGPMAVSPPPAPEGLTAERVAASRIRIRWRHGAAGRSTAIYEVYRDTAPGFSPSPLNRVAAAVMGEGYDDFDVQPQAAYTYCVRAKNVLGLESGFVRVQTTGRAGDALYGLIKASAASRVHGPLALRTDHTTGDTYLTAPSHAGSPLGGPGKEGLAVYELQIPKQGTYAIWAQARAPDGSSDSFYFALDTQELGRYFGWSVPVQDRWAWRPVRRFALTAGNHTLYIKHREDCVSLKALLLTDDLGYQPANY